MLQLVGHRAWKQRPDDPTISLRDVSTALVEAQRRLGRNVHAPALRPLSDIDRTYLLAMAQDAGASRTSDIAARLGVDKRYASVYRQRLITDGVIEAAGHGFVRFALPFLGDYLREHAASDALEGMAENGSPTTFP